MFIEFPFSLRMEYLLVRTLLTHDIFHFVTQVSLRKMLLSPPVTLDVTFQPAPELVSAPQALSSIQCQCHSRQLCRPRRMKHNTFIHQRNIIHPDRANNINMVEFLITHRWINIERRNALNWNIFRSTYVVIISDCDMPRCYEVLCYSTSSDCRGPESNWNLPAVEWTRRVSFVIADALYTFRDRLLRRSDVHGYSSCRCLIDNYV